MALEYCAITELFSSYLLVFLYFLLFCIKLCLRMVALQ